MDGNWHHRRSGWKWESAVGRLAATGCRDVVPIRNPDRKPTPLLPCRSGGSARLPRCTNLQHSRTDLSTALRTGETVLVRLAGKTETETGHVDLELGVMTITPGGRAGLDADLVLFRLRRTTTKNHDRLRCRPAPFSPSRNCGSAEDSFARRHRSCRAMTATRVSRADTRMRFAPGKTLPSSMSLDSGPSIPTSPCLPKPRPPCHCAEFIRMASFEDMGGRALRESGWVVLGLQRYKHLGLGYYASVRGWLPRRSS